MFMTEQELHHFKNGSYMYKGLPYAVIFYRELKRKNAFNSKLNIQLFINFFNRYDVQYQRLEVLFPDNSTLLIDFKQRKCHVYHPQTHFMDIIDI